MLSLFMVMHPNLFIQLNHPTLLLNIHLFNPSFSISSSTILLSFSIYISLNPSFSIYISLILPSQYLSLLSFLLNIHLFNPSFSIFISLILPSKYSLRSFLIFITPYFLIFITPSFLIFITILLNIHYSFLLNIHYDPS